MTIRIAIIDTPKNKKSLTTCIINCLWKPTYKNHGGFSIQFVLAKLTT